MVVTHVSYPYGRGDDDCTTDLDLGVLTRIGDEERHARVNPVLDLLIHTLSGRYQGKGSTAFRVLALQAASKMGDVPVDIAASHPPYV